MNDSRATTVSATTIAGVNLFSNLDQSARADVARFCDARRFRAGQEILAQSENSQFVYCIISGRVRVTFYSPAGKELSFRDQYPGETFGELAAIDGGARSAQVSAVIDTMALRIMADNFRRLVREYPMIAEKVILRLISLVRSLSDRVIEHSALGVNDRIHAELLRLASTSYCGGNEARIENPPTHAEIAARVSTHREAVSRELGHLSKIGLLDRTHRGLWVIANMDKFEEMTQKAKG